MPIFTSPGRGGFGPQLSLNYDSGNGNGVFGFGWQLQLPAITRKTDKGLPLYADADESDVFILSGAEDLVPLLTLQAGQWARETKVRQLNGIAFSVLAYRPRVEGLFARIERWTRIDDPSDVRWRSISKDNVTTWYGKSAESRIADPNDSSRIYCWYICESYDDRGNLILYDYKSEDSSGVAIDRAHERNRTDTTRSANRYPKRIRYCNRTPYLPDLTAGQPAAAPSDWCFEVVFDYGEHDDDAPAPRTEVRAWPCRSDPFSTYRPTFELRTYRLCRRVLMFHHFPGEPGVGPDCLVRSTDLNHADPTTSDSSRPFYSVLLSAVQTGYRRSGANSYASHSFPPLEFEYSEAVLDETVHEVDAESLQNLPGGIDGSRYRWLDLDGEGLGGVLSEQGGQWFRKPNLSPVQSAVSGVNDTSPAATLGAVQTVARVPATADLSGGGQQLLDLAGDGHLDLASFEPPLSGFFERTAEQGWAPFRPFESLPLIDWRNRNLKFIDLTGDGRADLLISENEAFCWHSSLGQAGFGPAQRALKAIDEEVGPRVVFADASESVFLADLSGDGLTDIVRIRNGETCYWPNLGYGRFGSKVTMDDAPWYEHSDLFDGRRLRLADIDGSGTTDIVYLASDGVQIYFNQSGNAFAPRKALNVAPPLDNAVSIDVFDLLGNGTGCLVWSSPLPGHARQSCRYVDLMAAGKPHLLVGQRNNLGAETRVQYSPSTKFYLADELAGNPWATRLPFPVHVVEQVETFDYVSRTCFVSRFLYHHGFYDGLEREFRGFGMVEQLDSEEYSYAFSTIDAPGATSTVLYGINDAGQIVGAQQDANSVFHSVLTDASASSFSRFDPDASDPAKESLAFDINNKGQIVGLAGTHDVSHPASRAYLKQGRALVFFGHPDADPSRGTDFYGINDAGVCVGNYADNVNTSHGFVKAGDTTTLLEASPGLPANNGNWLFDINNHGQMVGGYFDAVTDVQHGLLTDGATFTTIDFPGSDITWLNHINDLGQIVGAYFDNASQVFHGFLTDGHNFVTLDYPDLPPNFGTFITGIDNAGRIIGFYGAEAGLEGMLANTTPIHGFVATPTSGRARLGAATQGLLFSPPTRTRTWFHTGAFFGGQAISRRFEDEYYHEGDASDGVAGSVDDQFEAMLVDDTVLPTTLRLPDGARLAHDLTADEAREAARALKGSTLRQEVYADDGTDAADRPYIASERNYTIEALQPQGPQQHGVFFVQARETIDFHYERALYDAGNRRLADPRVTHRMLFAVDDFGNPLLSAVISYGRRRDDPDPRLRPDDRSRQRNSHVTTIVSRYTNATLLDDTHRAPQTAEALTFELIKVTPDRNVPDITNLFQFDELATKVALAGDGEHDLPYDDIDARGAVESHPYRRIVEHVRTLYRKDDLSSALALGSVDPLALPFENYKLALTPGLLALYRRGQDDLLPNPATVLRDEGGYALSDEKKAAGLFPQSDADGHWWLPRGRVFYSPNGSDTPEQEFANARAHFFLPRRYRNAFGNELRVLFDAHDLLPLETEDALGNRVSAGERVGDGLVNGNDYRVLQPTLVTDPNGNRAEVAIDLLGLVAGTAVMGKPSERLGDSLAGFVADLTPGQIAQFVADPRGAAANALLAGASSRIVYDLERFRRAGNFTPAPVFAASIARETHVNDLAPSESSRLQINFVYSDGFGREIQRKVQAEPGPLMDGGPVVSPRWVATGWVVLNNKGKPFRQYEPFFDATHEFQFSRLAGVSSTLFYDPPGRVVATLHPNHTWAKVVFDPWKQETWDVNDTVVVDPKLDPDAGAYFRLLPDDDYLPTWHTRRIGGAMGTEELDASQKAAAHADTPRVAYLDALGRTFLTLASNGPTVAEHFRTVVDLDIEGNLRVVTDALDRPIMRYDYDMLGTRIHQVSADAGERWLLANVEGNPLRAWDQRGHEMRYGYDVLRRPTDLFVVTGGGSPKLAERLTYGEADSDPETLNLRGKVRRQFDGAGVVSNGAYDFKGNLTAATRQMLQNYRDEVDWTNPPALESETFSSSTTFDALSRPVTVTTPDNSVVRPLYNEANLLEQLSVNLRGAAMATRFVTNIDYNARGQRLLIEFGNGAASRYQYDADTFRLERLLTSRQSDGARLQDLSYFYDPAGNITRIRDDAQQTIYFDGQVVTGTASYLYDAIYRLIEAKGREHIGQRSAPQTTFDDGPRMNLPLPTDAQAMRNYAERYGYDAVGNIQSFAHDAVDGSWTRDYTYAAGNNQLAITTVGSAQETYSHDAHGNMTFMPHLPAMEWDFKDQLHISQRQVVNEGPGEKTFYFYDRGGQRVRKVTERSDGSRKNERLYLGGFETYREYDAGGDDTVALERETLHVMDVERRIALVETRTRGTEANVPDQAVRYQFDNHLRSAALEVDGNASVISYEEYYPYGSTSYQAGRSVAEVSLKRYRYSGQERDAETGFTYHGARYCSPWIGRWTSCDPAGMVDGTNVFAYARNNPIQFLDPSGKQSAPTANQDDKLNQTKQTSGTGTPAANPDKSASSATSEPSTGGERQSQSDQDRPKEKEPAVGTFYLFTTTQSADEEIKRKRKQVLEAMLSQSVNKDGLSNAQVAAIWRTVNDTRAVGFSITVQKDAQSKDYSVTVGGVYHIWAKDEAKSPVKVGLYVLPIASYSETGGTKTFSVGFSAIGSASADLSKDVSLDLTTTVAGGTSAQLTDNKTLLAPVGSLAFNAGLTKKTSSGWQIPIEGSVTWTSGFARGASSTTSSKRFYAGTGLGKTDLFGVPFIGINLGVSNETILPPFTPAKDATKATTGTIGIVGVF